MQNGMCGDLSAGGTDFQFLKVMCNDTLRPFVVQLNTQMSELMVFFLCNVLSCRCTPVNIKEKRKIKQAVGLLHGGGCAQKWKQGIPCFIPHGMWDECPVGFPNYL